MVDRLLASPAYGERWGRHWLDLVRYCDDFEEAWRYRDWVVSAFNDDLPYDQFVREQIAGDLLPGRRPGAVNADGIVATTCWRSVPGAGSTAAKRLADIVDDQIDTVGRPFLGLTLACARCHDHKFDPITTDDYYGLAGIFFSSHVSPESGYLSHGTPRLRIPLVPPAEVETHERHMARVREWKAGSSRPSTSNTRPSRRACCRRSAATCWPPGTTQHRPADEAGLSSAEFASRRGLLQAYALRQWIEYLSGAPARRLSAARSARPRLRRRAGRPGLADRRRTSLVGRQHHGRRRGDRDVPPPAALGLDQPGDRRGRGRLEEPDRGDGPGRGQADGRRPARRRRRRLGDRPRVGRRAPTSSPRGDSPTAARCGLDEGRVPSRLASIPVRVGDVLHLQIVLGKGTPTTTSRNVELTIARAGRIARDGTWRGTSRADFLAGNPHGDVAGNAAVWHFFDMAGSHRLARMPAVDRLLQHLGRGRCAFAAGKLDRRRSRRRPGRFERGRRRPGRSRR